MFVDCTVVLSHHREDKFSLHKFKNSKCDNLIFHHYSQMSSYETSQTLRHAGAVVLIQTVSWSTETHIRTIWKLSAEMFTSPISVSAAMGGHTFCEKETVENHLYFSWHQQSWTLIKVSTVDGIPTFVTVGSMETRGTFAGIGVEVASTRRAVLTGRRQAVIHSCKQEDFNKHFNTWKFFLFVHNRLTICHQFCDEFNVLLFILYFWKKLKIIPTYKCDVFNFKL